MQDFLYDNYTRLLFGKEAEAQLGAQAAEFSKAKKALIVYGSDRVKKDGLLGRSEQALQAQGFETKCLGGVVPNPRLSKVHEGIQMAREMGADFILGVGGGSVMDTAKAIAAVRGRCMGFCHWQGRIGHGAAGGRSGYDGGHGLGIQRMGRHYQRREYVQTGHWRRVFAAGVCCA